MKVIVYYVNWRADQDPHPIWRGRRTLALPVDLKWWAAHQPDAQLAIDPTRYDLADWDGLGARFIQPPQKTPPHCCRVDTAQNWLLTLGLSGESQQSAWVMPDERLVRKMCAGLQGRRLRSEEVLSLLESQGIAMQQADLFAYVQSGYLQGKLQVSTGMAAVHGRNWWGKSVSTLCCRRCGERTQLHVSPCAQCGRDNCTYCLTCLQMGRVRTCTLLVHGVVDADAPFSTISPIGGGDMSDLAQWGLSEPQHAAALLGLDFLRHPMNQHSSVRATAGTRDDTAERPTFLIWAVTGAGKTEMLFPFIADRLAHGRTIAIASPRRDVVIELEPRLKKAFAQASIVVLHGASKQRWEQGHLFLTTTHQLLRFYQAFDLVVIDEVDAFPYHNDLALQRAARQACKIDGKFVLLSATPPSALQREIRSGRLAHAKVPVRYHGHPLPVPELIIRRHPRRRYAALCERLWVSLRRGAQIFVFVPRIAEVAPLVSKLQAQLATRPEGRDASGHHVVVAGTSSKDEARAEKVSAFRERAIRLLVTTTILERGVTIAKADVYIYDADSGLFDEAALVQMAGRAGRNKDDPAGKVAFFAADRTQSQIGAVRQIRQMNRLAHKKGYLRT